VLTRCSKRSLQGCNSQQNGIDSDGSHFVGPASEGRVIRHASVQHVVISTEKPC
jgi:hypothetical protein